MAAVKTTPAVRTDADYLDDLMLEACELYLYAMADMVNGLTRAGRIFPNILLPPDEATRKKELMEGPNGS